MKTAWAERKSNLFENLAKKDLNPEPLVIVYPDTMTFFFCVHLKRRGNF